MKKEIYETIIDSIADNYDNYSFLVYDSEKDDIFWQSYDLVSGYDEEYCIKIPTTTSKEAYQLMVSFVRDTQSPRIAFQFNQALSQNKPFARFNKVLESLHKENEFRNYQRKIQKTIVDEWMKNYNIKLENEDNFKFDIPGWESKFSSQILQRGLDYYKQGKVSYAKVYDDVITAKVFNYDISIKYKNSAITKMYCDCPCDFNCKHQAAVMYYVTNEKIEKNKPVDNLNLNIDHKKIIRNSLNSLKEDDDYLLNEITSYFNSDNDYKLDFLKELINSIVYAKKYNFLTRNKIIDYLIDKAVELNDVQSLISLLKTSSLEEYSSKVISVLRNNYQSDEEVKKMLAEEETIQNFIV